MAAEHTPKEVADERTPKEVADERTPKEVADELTPKRWQLNTSKEVAAEYIKRSNNSAHTKRSGR